MSLNYLDASDQWLSIYSGVLSVLYYVTVKTIRRGVNAEMKGYLDNLEQSIKGNHSLFFPMDHDKRVKMAGYLARSIAHGLKDYPIKQVTDIIPTLYGRFHVQHSLDSVGPVVDAKDFHGIIHKIAVEGRPSP